MPRTTHFVAVCALLFASLAQGQDAGPTAAAPPPKSQLTAELFYQLLLSELSLQNEDIGAAFGLMLNAARRAPEPQLFQRAIEIALRGRDANAALTAAKAWQQALPESLDADRYLLQLLVGLNRLSEAVAPTQRILARADDAERAATLVFVSRFFTRASDKTAAADLLEKAFAKDLSRVDTGPVAWAMVGNLRLLAGAKPAALAAARKGAQLNPLSDDVALLGVNLLDADFEGAQTLLAPYLAAKPVPEIQMGYVRKLVELQRYPKALAQVEQMNRNQPDYPEAWLVRGSIEFQNTTLSAAEASLKRYLSLVQTPVPAQTTPDADAKLTPRGAVQAYLLLAQIAQKNRDLTLALTYLGQINSPQDEAKIQLRRAMVLAQQGQLAQARALLRQLPEKDTDDARNKISLELQLLRDNQQEQEAYDWLVLAVQKFPADAELRYELAISAEKLGRPDEMEQILRRLMVEKPDYHAAYNALGYSLADRNQRLPEARALINKALQFAPDDPFIIDSLAWVEFRSGNLNESLALLQKAFTARPDAEIAAHLGEVLWTLNLRDQASTTWQEGLQLNRDNETLKSTILRLRGNL
ncbi:MAG: tetratricopeptide repeat protein [Rhodoferax sp.]|nr:tetratricopeptide repeat protein [Rhodoferax sp.]